MAENQLMMINPFEALETGRKRAYAGYEAGQAAAQREVLNELYAQATDPTTGRIDRNRLMSGLAQRRMGSMIPQLEAEEARLAEQRGKAMQEQAKGLEAQMQTWKRMIPADPRLAPAWVEAAYADPVVGALLGQLGSKEDVIAGIPQDPEGYASWVEGASMFADELSKRRVLTAEQATTAETTRRGQDITARGQDITAATTRRGQDITAATAREGQRVTMRGQDINAAIQSPEYQGLITQARERAKSDVSFADQFNAADQTARRTLSLLDSIVGDAQIVDGKIVVQEGKRKPMKGFEGAVGAGFGQRFIPGTAARDFNAAHDQAVGAAFMQAFATLKGGGQITEKEGEKATAALTRMNLAQSEVEYIRAAREFQREVKNVLNLAETRYRKLNPSFTAAPTPGAGAPSVEDLLEKYK